MKKIVFILFLFLLVGCSNIDIYDKINPSYQEITTIEEYEQLIQVAREFEFKYFYFIDFRKESEFTKSHITHFSKNIDFTKNNSKTQLLNYLSERKNIYIVIISEVDDNINNEVKEFLTEEGYSNIKNITIGYSNFKKLIEDANLGGQYLSGGDCGC